MMTVMATHPFLEDNFSCACSGHKIGGNVCEFNKEICEIVLSMAAAMSINSVKNIHIHPSPRIFDSLKRGSTHDHLGNYEINSIVSSIFTSNLDEFKQDRRIFKVLKTFSTTLVDACKNAKKE